MSIISAGGAVVGAGGAAGYQIERSLRFNSAESAYLNRTPAVAGNRQTWTYSFWIKRSKLTRVMLLGAYTSGSDVAVIEIDSDQIGWYDYLSAYRYELRTTQVLRDPSAWYHIMCVLDTTQATSSNRNKIYINGSLVTALTTATYPTEDLDGKFNTAIQHSIGTEGSNVRLTFDGYQTETYFIDGQALDPTSFGEFNATTGVWQPIEYTGSYGTQGWFLNFSDNSGVTAATLGADSSGNGNNWTPNGFVVSPVASADNDSLVDTPTPYGTDTGVGGEVRGNYATLNPLSKSSFINLANGNLDTSGNTATNEGVCGSTIAVKTGKWYAEFTMTGANVSNRPNYGIIPNSNANFTNGGGDFAVTAAMRYGPNGTVYTAGSLQGTYSTFTTGNVIGIAIDSDNGAVYISNDGVFQNSGEVLEPFNFGQRPFDHAAPTGFKALCTQNLPEPTIVDGGEYFNTVLYTGNGSTQSITGVGFQPDFVWVKARSIAYANRLYDAVRGFTKELYSNLTDAENTEINTITAVSSDGFSLGDALGVNGNTQTFVAWNWKANGAGVSNTDGTITSTVSANTTSGISICTYTGTGVAATIGHGLGAKPSFFIIKKRTNSGTEYGWYCYSSVLDATNHLVLNTTAGSSSSSFLFDDTEPSSSAPYVFTVGTSPATNEISIDYVAYCFAAIPGYSAFGSYTGNNAADGTFVYLGFRPSFLMIKSTSASTEWVMVDNTRPSTTPGVRNFNLVDTSLYANRAYSEATIGTVDDIDLLSNGFKLRNNTGFVNASQTYIYMAFAESPFKYCSRPIT
jgi:hypothetical protein